MGHDRWRGPSGVFRAVQRLFQAPVEGMERLFALAAGCSAWSPSCAVFEGWAEALPLESCLLLVCPGPSPLTRGGRWTGTGARSASVSSRLRPPDLSRIRGQEGRRPEAVTGRFSPGAVLVLGGRAGKVASAKSKGVSLCSSAWRGLVPSPCRNVETPAGGSAFRCLGFRVFVLRDVDF